MSVHIVYAMLPDDQGKINKLLLHEGILNLHLMQICILIISFQPWMVINWSISIGLMQRVS
jgi:hypothetical protein